MFFISKPASLIEQETMRGMDHRRGITSSPKYSGKFVSWYIFLLIVVNITPWSSLLTFIGVATKFPQRTQIDQVHLVQAVYQFLDALDSPRSVRQRFLESQEPVECLVGDFEQVYLNQLYLQPKLLANEQ
jgi:hypothetical protein